ncbi:MAG: ATP-binding protein, partial [Myxococcota bacterium]
QVLINLIRNAADAVPEERRAQIVLSIDETESDAVIRVVDNGRGVRAKVAERLFEPFFTTKGGQGLGLGLDISRKIIAAHGGQIDLESTSDQGTTFRVSLPLASK